ncbi:MAG: SprT family zinc-dependent metalloprotease [Methanomicrobiales archaeon]|nr:SprT family zinc-dependent metalloprotease [Methanomicrobiales archaeon]MDI6876933.1 SprT family zinc-dependent metalloprotease [Methanomicrobiales archaeon]
MVPGPDETDVEVLRRAVTVMRLRVLPDGRLQVTAPPGVDVEPFIRRKSAWIEKKRRELADLTEDTLGTEDLLLLNGRYYLLRQGTGCGFADDGALTYSTPQGLRTFLIANLKSDLARRVERAAKRMRVDYESIGVRTQKTRWASCSGRKHLSFNLALAALPDPLRDYVVVHELAHLIHPDHSPLFWQTVETYCPDLRQADRDLRKYWIVLQRNRCWRVIREMGEWENRSRRPSGGS